VLSSVTPGAASRAYLAFVRDPPTHLRYSMQIVYILYRRDPYVNSGGVASDSALSRRMPTPEAMFRRRSGQLWNRAEPLGQSPPQPERLSESRTVYSQLSRIKRLARSTMDG